MAAVRCRRYLFGPSLIKSIRAPALILSYRYHNGAGPVMSTNRPGSARAFSFRLAAGNIQGFNAGQEFPVFQLYVYPGEGGYLCSV